MAIELQAVIGAALILFLIVGIQGALVPLNQGFGWGLGSRDEAKSKTALQGRAARTVANHIESMCIFVPLALVVIIADLASPLTAWGAGLYIVGRIAYAPLYLLGVPYLRSAAWAVSVTGILLIGYVALLAAFAG